MRTVLILGLLGLYTGAAGAATLDFEDLRGSVGTFERVNTATQGYSLSSPTDGDTAAIWFPAPVGVSIGLVGGTGALTVSRQDGAAFNLFSFDYGARNQTTMEIVVESASGDTQVVTFTDLLLGNSSAPVPNTLDLPDTFRNIQSISLSGAGPMADQIFFVDNFVVTVVPVPAAFWLLSSCLAGLGWLARRR